MERAVPILRRFAFANAGIGLACLALSVLTWSAPGTARWVVLGGAVLILLNTALNGLPAAQAIRQPPADAALARTWGTQSMVWLAVAEAGALMVLLAALLSAYAADPPVFAPTPAFLAVAIGTFVVFASVMVVAFVLPLARIGLGRRL